MGSGGVITDVTNAIVRNRATMLEGVVASVPALLIGDGKSTQYACDVQISLLTSNGQHNQTKLELEGVPGGVTYNVADTTTIGTILRNVPIVANNGSLLYASLGTGVVLTKTSQGQWQVSGLTQRLNGTQFRYAINLGTTTIGPVTNTTTVVRLLTLGELTSYGGGFGIIPFGAGAIFVGGVYAHLANVVTSK
jgi:hypothetical protein